MGDLLPQRTARHRSDILAIDQDPPGADVVETRRGIDTVDLPPPNGPTSAVNLPGWATKLMPRSTGAIGTVRKIHIVEFDTRGRQPQRRQVMVVQVRPAGCR